MTCPSVDWASAVAALGLCAFGAFTVWLMARGER